MKSLALSSGLAEEADLNPALNIHPAQPIQLLRAGWQDPTGPPAGEFRESRGDSICRGGIWNDNEEASAQACSPSWKPGSKGFPCDEEAASSPGMKSQP